MDIKTLEKISFSKTTIPSCILGVGSEVEGIWRNSARENMHEILKMANFPLDKFVSGTDGSIALSPDCYPTAHKPLYKRHRELCDTESYSARENRFGVMRTRRELEAFRSFLEFMIAGEHLLWNDSCGLHFHVSVKPWVLPFITNVEFYQAYVDLTKLKHREVYDQRQGNGYCRYEPYRRIRARSPLCKCDSDCNCSTCERCGYAYQRTSNGGHLSSIHGGERRRPIRYALSEHGTIEFRFFGSFAATPDSYVDHILETLTLIDIFSRNKKRYDLHSIKGKPNNVIVKEVFNMKERKEHMLESAREQEQTFPYYISEEQRLKFLSLVDGMASF